MKDLEAQFKQLDPLMKFFWINFAFTQSTLLPFGFLHKISIFRKWYEQRLFKLVLNTFVCHTHPLLTKVRKGDTEAMKMMLRQAKSSSTLFDDWFEQVLKWPTKS